MKNWIIAALIAVGALTACGDDLSPAATATPVRVAEQTVVITCSTTLANGEEHRWRSQPQIASQFKNGNERSEWCYREMRRDLAHTRGASMEWLCGGSGGYVNGRRIPPMPLCQADPVVRLEAQKRLGAGRASTHTTSHSRATPAAVWDAGDVQAYTYSCLRDGWPREWCECTLRHVKVEFTSFEAWLYSKDVAKLREIGRRCD